MSENQSQRARLERVFDDLRAEQIVATLLMGDGFDTTRVYDGDTDDPRAYYQAAAAANAAPGRWAGALVGPDGGHWVNEVLHHRQPGSTEPGDPVAQLHFAFPRQAPGIAASMVAAFEQHAFYAFWGGDPKVSVLVDLAEEPAP